MNQHLSSFRAAGNFLLNLVYPRTCPVCGKLLDPALAFHKQKTKEYKDARSSISHKSGGLRENKYVSDNPFICPGCYEKIHFPSEPRCLKCSRPIWDETQAYCSDCARRIRHFDRGIALLNHDEIAKKMLYGLKYSNRRDYADPLAVEAAVRCGGRIRRWNPQVFLPVPLYKKKELQRGFNQAEVLARRLSYYMKQEDFQVPVDDEYLIRAKRTSAQKELSLEERSRNIHGAFDISYKRCAGEYERVLLIDDIYTSGATLSECARVLKENGTREVYFLTFSIG